MTVRGIPSNWWNPCGVTGAPLKVCVLRLHATSVNKRFRGLVSMMTIIQHHERMMDRKVGVGVSDRLITKSAIKIHDGVEDKGELSEQQGMARLRTGSLPKSITSKTLRRRPDIKLNHQLPHAVCTFAQQLPRFTCEPLAHAQALC